MNDQEKLNEIADVLEVEPEDLTKDTVLNDIETWDSVAVLSFIAVMNDKFDKFPNAMEIRGYKTVGDLMSVMTKDEA